jgi:hypothetical protein
VDSGERATLRAIKFAADAIADGDNSVEAHAQARIILALVENELHPLSASADATDHDERVRQNEREACAKVADAANEPNENLWSPADIAAAIRARSTKGVAK